MVLYAEDGRGCWATNTDGRGQPLFTEAFNQLHEVGSLVPSMHPIRFFTQLGNPRLLCTLLPCKSRFSNGVCSHAKANSGLSYAQWPEAAENPRTLMCAGSLWPKVHISSSATQAIL